MNDETLKSRRDFFKKTLKGALPFLGVLTLSNVPLNLLAKNEWSGECSCIGHCEHSCTADCTNSCRSCEISCSNDCDNGCLGSCHGDCKRSCLYSCIESCKNYLR